MASIKTLSNLKTFEKMFNPETIKRTVVDALADEGEAIIQNAYFLREWQNRTYNLRDSFVSAVFVNGKLQNGSIRYVGPELSESYENYGEDEDGTFAIQGRTEAENFIKSYASTHTMSKGIQLVVAATMYYASILESKGYHVISEIYTSAEEALRRIKSLKIKPYLGAHHSIDLMFEGIVRRVDDVAEGARTFRFK